jgi:hypothetical protein
MRVKTSFEETGEKAPMAFFDRGKSIELFADHRASLAAAADASRSVE